MLHVMHLLGVLLQPGLDARSRLPELAAVTSVSSGIPSPPNGIPPIISASLNASASSSSWATGSTRRGQPFHLLGGRQAGLVVPAGHELAHPLGRRLGRLSTPQSRLELEPPS